MRDSEVPTFGEKGTTAEEEEAVWELGAELGIVNRSVRVGETGSAVRFACFLRIFRMASVVANWNYRETCKIYHACIRLD
jgi:hypothetical protein